MKRTALSLCCVFVLAVTAIAQKLPNKQEKSVWAPADIKIDGITTEWQNQFQAYNKATDLFYTVSNDDKNLYLIVQATIHDVIDKLLRGGITFAVSSDKSDKNSISITYPFLEGHDVYAVAGGYTVKYVDYKDSKKAEANATDVKAVNDIISTTVKLMKVTGVESFTEPNISVYNETGIKVAAHFDSKLAYTYELAIPLSYLKLTDKGVFNYHIKVNELPEPTSAVAYPPPVPATAMGTTDFWGQYTLAKKLK